MYHHRLKVLVDSNDFFYFSMIWINCSRSAMLMQAYHCTRLIAVLLLHEALGLDLGQFYRHLLLWLSTETQKNGLHLLAIHLILIC